MVLCFFNLGKATTHGKDSQIRVLGLMKRDCLLFFLKIKDKHCLNDWINQAIFFSDQGIAI